MKIAIVVQRYGADINGGAELHARYIAERLARHVTVEVLTTCATDYISWRNDRPAGVEAVHGVPVRRFPVARERDPKEFGDWSARVFTRAHSVRDELSWLEAEGPTSPALVQYIEAHADDFDFFIFFSFRYYHSFHGARTVAGKAILVPTAERDGALGLGIFPPVFRGVRAFMYNSYEERALIQAVSGNTSVPGVVVGVGSEIPERPNPGRFRQKFQLPDRFAIYVGRIDENKGCKQLFEFFQHYSATLLDGLHLVLIGTAVLPVPKHPHIRHLGFVTDEDKFDAIAAAEVLIMPSFFESLSMVALEAWALGKPVIANAACDVLHGQCLRSNAGLYYDGFPEFFETLRTIDGNPSLASALGRNGRQYFQRHYSWPVIEQKYLDMLERLRREPATGTLEPLPGWWAGRRRSLEAADAVVTRLPRGPVTPATAAAVEAQPSPRRPHAPPVVERSEPRARAAQPERRPAATVGDAPGAPRPVARGRGHRDARPDRARAERPADARPPREERQPGTRQPGGGQRRRPMRGRRRHNGGR